MGLMKTATPMKSAKAYAIRNYGVFWFTAMSEQSRKQLLAAYIAGHRAGKRQRNGRG